MKNSYVIMALFVSCFFISVAHAESILSCSGKDSKGNEINLSTCADTGYKGLCSNSVDLTLKTRNGEQTAALNEKKIQSLWLGREFIGLVGSDFSVSAEVYLDVSFKPKTAGQRVFAASNSLKVILNKVQYSFSSQQFNCKLESTNE